MQEQSIMARPERGETNAPATTCIPPAISTPRVRSKPVRSNYRLEVGMDRMRRMTVKSIRTNPTPDYFAPLLVGYTGTRKNAALMT